jgi:hypothetical protein
MPPPSGPPASIPPPSGATQVLPTHWPTVQLHCVCEPHWFMVMPQKFPPGHVAGGQKHWFVELLHCSPLVQGRHEVDPHEFVSVPHWPASQVGGGHEHTLLTHDPPVHAPQFA